MCAQALSQDAPRKLGLGAGVRCPVQPVVLGADTLVVSSWKTEALQLFTKGGTKLATVLHESVRGPAGMACFGNELFVASSSAAQIACFSWSEDARALVFKRAFGQGLLTYPYGLTILESELYVLDAPRLEVFSLAGNHLRSLELTESIGSYGGEPMHLTSHAGLLLASSAQGIAVLRPDGTLVRRIGESAFNRMPAGVAARAGIVFASEANGRRIQAFRIADGSPCGMAEVGASRCGMMGASIDGSQLYVGDDMDNGVFVFELPEPVETGVEVRFRPPPRPAASPSPPPHRSPAAILSRRHDP